MGFVSLCTRGFICAYPTDSGDINTPLQLNDTSSTPPTNAGFLFIIL